MNTDLTQTAASVSASAADYTKIQPILRSVAVVAICGPTNSGAIDSLVGAFVAIRGPQSKSETADTLANPKRIFVEPGSNPDQIVEDAIKAVKDLGPNVIPVIAMTPLDRIRSSDGLPHLGPSILRRILQDLESQKVHGVIAIGIVSRENPALEETVFCRRNGNDSTADAFDRLLEIAGAATSIHLSVYDDTPISEVVRELAHHLEYRLFINPPNIISTLTVPSGFGLEVFREAKEASAPEPSDEEILAQLIAAKSLEFANMTGSTLKKDGDMVVNIPETPLLLSAKEIVGVDRADYNPPDNLTPDDFPSIKGKRILIIDDQPETTVFQTAALDWASEGNVTVFQHQGQSAEEVAKIMLDYDLVVIDRTMGIGIDKVRVKGEDCVRKYNELTAESQSKRAQIFSFTGETAEPEIIAAFAKQGVRAFVKEADVIHPVRFLAMVNQSLAA